MLTTNGKVYIIAGPKGVGKTSILNRLSNECGFYTVLQTKSTPMKEIGNGERVSHQNEIKSGLYHTLEMENINQVLSGGKDVFIESSLFAVKGLRTLFTDSVSILIYPPSISVYEERLKGRKEEAQHINNQIQSIDIYDYVVCNDNLDKACTDIRSISIVNKLSNNKQDLLKESGILPFDKNLVDKLSGSFTTPLKDNNNEDKDLINSLSNAFSKNTTRETPSSHLTDSCKSILHSLCIPYRDVIDEDIEDLADDHNDFVKINLNRDESDRIVSVDFGKNKDGHVLTINNSDHVKCRSIDDLFVTLHSFVVGYGCKSKPSQGLNKNINPFRYSPSNELIMGTVNVEHKDLLNNKE